MTVPRGRIPGGGPATAAITVVLLGVLLRLGVVYELGDDLRVTDPIIDGKLYLQQAAAWIDGQRLDEPHFSAPLYPTVISVLLRLGATGVGAIHGFQAALGLLGTLFLGLAVRRNFGNLAGFATGILAAFYGPLLAIETQVLGASLLFFGVCFALWLWPTPQSPASRWAAFGLTLGILAVGRGTFGLLLIGFLCVSGSQLLGLVRRSAAVGHKTRHASRSDALRWLCLLAAFLGPILWVAVHQTRTTESVQLTSLNGGLNFYVGNNPWARGIYSTPPDLDIQADFTGRESASRHLRRNATLPEADRFWRNRALTFLRTDPSRASWLWARKSLLYLSPREVPQIENFRLLAHDTMSLNVAAVRFGWLLPLCVLGVGLARSRAVGPYLVVIVTGLISTLLFFATARYRIPFVPGFLAVAGIGLAGCVEALRARQFDRRLTLGIAFALTVAALQWTFPSYPIEKADAFAFQHLGLRYQQRGEHASAIREFQRALSTEPGLGNAWQGIAASRTELQDLPGAIAAYREAVERSPDPTWALYNLGITYGRNGEDGPAADAFLRARDLQPNDPRIRERLATALGRIGKLDEARTEIEVALQLDPTHGPSLRTKRLLEKAVQQQ